MKKVIVTWPESQMFCEKKDFRKNAELINSDKGLELYGSSAYLVKESYYNDVINGLVDDADENDEDDDELIINYEFPNDNDLTE